MKAAGGNALLVYYRPDRSESEDKSRQLTWRKWHWILLAFLCCYWMVITIIHHGWADKLWTVLEPLECLLTLPLFLTSLWLIQRAIRFAHGNRTWRSVILLFVIMSTLLMMVLLPTNAGLFFQQRRPSIAAISDRAENIFPYGTGPLGRGIMVDSGGETEGWWKRYYDRERNLWVLCVRFEAGSPVGLVGSSTGNLQDCACSGFRYYNNVGHCAWARRINEHWFETSESLSLWYFQPGQAAEYWFDKNPIYLGPGRVVSFSCLICPAS